MALTGDVAPVVAALSDVGSLVSARKALGGSAPERIREHGATVRDAVAAGRAWADAAAATAWKAEDDVVATARALVGGSGGHGPGNGVQR